MQRKGQIGGPVGWQWAGGQPVKGDVEQITGRERGLRGVSKALAVQIVTYQLNWSKWSFSALLQWDNVQWRRTLKRGNGHLPKLELIALARRQTLAADGVI